MKTLIKILAILISIFTLSCGNGKSDGEVSIASSQKGDSIGTGQSTMPGGVEIKGKLKNGKREGKWVGSYAGANWVLVEENYKDGLLEASSYNFNPNGRVSLKRNYHLGIQDGEEIYYNEDGSVNIVGNFKDGKREGEQYSMLYANGVQYKTDVNFYKNGIFVIDSIEKPNDGEFIKKFEDGSISYKENYKNGLLDGESIHYYATGQVESKCTYLHGKLNGVLERYYSNGKLMYAADYLNGKQHGLLEKYEVDGTLLVRHYTSTDSEIVADRKHSEEVKEMQNVQHYASDGQKCKQCFGHYRGGFCSLCGAASPDRVYETYSKSANCEMCKGSGYVPKGGIHGGNKICPSCKGNGKQIY